MKQLMFLPYHATNDDKEWCIVRSQYHDARSPDINSRDIDLDFPEYSRWHQQGWHSYDHPYD